MKYCAYINRILYLTLSTILFILPLFVYCDVSQKYVFANKQRPLILYVPGWRNKGISQKDQIKLLKKIYPLSKVIVKVWNSDEDFGMSKSKADKYAEFLATEIDSMSLEKQQNIVLIGHSLGGRIVIKTLAYLKSRKVSIRRGIFLGAAIPDNAMEIESAITSTIEPCINVYYRNDYVLRHIYPSYKEGKFDALGAYGYSKPFHGIHMLQYEKTSSKDDNKKQRNLMKTKGNHSVKIYLSKLAEIEKTLPRSNSIDFYLERDSKWITFKKFCNWKLERQTKTAFWRIVNAHNQIIFFGNERNAVNLWKQYSRRYEETSQEKIDRIIVMQDKKNPVFKVIPRLLWLWKVVDEKDGWRLQQGVIRRGTYRIIDPKDFQRANGRESKMRESFENIKKQLNTKR